MATLLLPLYCFVDSLRSLVFYSAVRSQLDLSPSAVTFAAEVIKLAVAIAGLVLSTPAQGFLRDRFLLPPSQHDGTTLFASFKPYLRFAVPAVLYGFNNVLFLEALHYTTPALLQVSALSKLPLTAILHHFIIRPRRSRAMWLSLAALSVGVVLAGCPEQLWDPRQRNAILSTDFVSGPLIGLTVGAVSACSSVWTELMLKEKVDFWQAQFYLYVWGTLFTGPAVVIANFRVVPDAETTPASLPVFLLVACVTAATGLVVALILRQRDNLVKLVGASLCITTVFVLQRFLFPLTDNLDARTTFGIGLVTLSTLCYNWYKDDHVGQRITRNGHPELPLSGDGEAQTPRQRSSRLLPQIRYRLAVTRCILGTLMLTSTVTLFGALFPTNDRSIEKDVKRFFRPRGIAPAAWDVPLEDPGCFRRYSGGGEVNIKSSFLADLNDRIAESGCPVFPIPDAGIISHIFWAGPWRNASHGLTIDAWLATQPFETSSLSWWYERGSPPPPDVVERYTGAQSPYRTVVSFREFDARLADGTCLADMREWTDAEYRNDVVGMPVSTRSDLVRLLLLAKFGGVWLDTDSIALRDLTPLVRVGPAIASFEGTINNNFLVYGPAWSGVGARVLALACTMPYDERKMKELEPELDMGDYFWWLYNSGVHKLCQTRGCGVGDIAMQLVDGKHWTKQSFEPCERGKYPDGSGFPPHVHGPFTWHARMTQLDDSDPCYDRRSGTLLSAVKQRVESILEQHAVSVARGRDLFPGPGYVS